MLKLSNKYANQISEKANGLFVTDELLVIDFNKLQNYSAALKGGQAKK